jgi:hypothetical protein
MPDWEGPKRQKQPKEKSSRPDGRTVGMAIVMFIVTPLTVVAAFGWYFLHAYNVI